MTSNRHAVCCSDPTLLAIQAPWKSTVSIKRVINGCSSPASTLYYVVQSDGSPAASYAERARERANTPALVQLILVFHLRRWRAWRWWRDLYSCQHPAELHDNELREP